MHASNSNIHTERIVATVTIEEVTRLTGKTACVTPAVCAWYWTGQTHTPAPVLIGVLGAMPATLVSEPEKKNPRHATQVITLMDCMCSTHHNELLESDICA